MPIRKIGVLGRTYRHINRYRELIIVDAQGAAFATGVVLGGMKAVGRQGGDGPQGAAPVPRVHALGRVLENAHTVLRAQAEQGVHVGTDPGVVYRADGGGVLGAAIS